MSGAEQGSESEAVLHTNKLLVLDFDLGSAQIYWPEIKRAGQHKTILKVFLLLSSKYVLSRSGMCNYFEF